MNSGIHMWREVEGKTVFRFQTNEKSVHVYMSQSEGFKLVGWGVNFNLWIYSAEFSLVENAKKALEFSILKK